MAAIEKIGSYVEMLQDYIPEQYKGSARLLGLIDSMLVQCDALEDALFEILGSIDLETATGPALDFLGAIIGVARNPGETDEAYRTRIYRFRSLKAAPTYEGIREMLELLTGQTGIGLYPNWPAELYWVPPQAEEYELSQLIAESVTSGVSLVQGTFLCCEDGEAWGLIVLEDNGQPLVVDQRWPDTLYELVDDDGNYLVDSEGNHLVALDFLTTT